RTLVSGTLPPGLTRSGAVISGTPTVAGTSTFNVIATGADGASSPSTPMTITITPDFGITIPNNDQSIMPGQFGDYLVTILPQAGFQGPVTLSASANPALPAQNLSINT